MASFYSIRKYSEVFNVLSSKDIGRTSLELFLSGSYFALKNTSPDVCFLKMMSFTELSCPNWIALFFKKMY